MADRERTDVGDEEQVKRRKSKAQIAQETDDENLRRLLQDKRNRSVIWKFLESTGAFTTLSMRDGQEMAVRSGLRDAGLWWIRRMNEVDPNAFVLMQYETIARDDNGS